VTRFRFGAFVVDDDTVEIIGPDGVREVQPQVFDVLRYLVEQPGRLVTKEELLDNVWGDRFVSESALTTRIKQARRAIDDDGATQWAIKTVHGRGYRFLPDVETSAAAPAADPSGAATVRAPAPSVLPQELRADARQPFCGRRDEMGHATAILDRAAHDGPFGWLWILGEPGIGKTRLAAEVARLAGERGHQVLFGRNGEDLRVPYQPFIEALLPTSATADAPTADVPADLAPFLPSLGGPEAAHPTASSSIDDETRRYRMFEALAERMIDLSAAAPVTMIIDDAHWAADSTLQLLSHLQHRRDGGAVTLVLTSRDTAPDVNPRVADLIAAGIGQATTAVLRLQGLTSDEAVRLVGDGVDMDDVMRQTAGNPLFLQAVNRADGSVDMPSAVRRRLASLDERVQETLRVGSVLGLEFELRVAAAATERDELDLLDDLELAVAARLLDDVGHDRFRFTHALVRSSLRSELSSSRQARMHRRIAIAIHDVFGDDPRHLLELAHHTAEAAGVDATLRPTAVERLRRAAQESSAGFSFDEAAELMRRARTLVDPADALLGARLALEQGIAESRAGQNMTAARTFATAISAARTTDEVGLRVEAALRYEDASWRPGLPGEAALELIDEATDVLDDAIRAGAVVDDEPELRARLAVARLRALAMSGRAAEAGTAFTEARRLAAELGSPNIEANVLGVYLGQVMLYERVHEAAEMVQRLAELEPLIDDGDVALHAIHDRILYATLTGRHDERRRLVRTMAEQQERSHSRFWEFIRSNQEAMEAFYRGDLAASEALAEHCLELAAALPEEDGSGTYGLRMFLIRREQDRLAAIAPVIRHVLATADESTIWTPGLALLLVETGDRDGAAAALHAAKAGGFDLPVDAMWSTVMVLLIETMVQLGDVEACAVLRSRFEHHAGSNVTTGSGLLCFGRAERYLGMLSFVMGHLDVAEEYLGTAMEADAAGDSVLWRNESRLWLSRVRRAQGHRDEADAMLDVVAREADAAGLRRLARLAAARPA
jgi:DNA-binding winged helix-turn-helix (wHTH) protein/tetratricopeptide (TPR) repeat protein